MAKKKAQRVIVLGRRAYHHLHKLTVFTDACPLWLELGDHAWDQIEGQWQDALQPKLTEDEIVTSLECEGTKLVAVIEERGVEYRVEIRARATK